MDGLAEGPAEFKDESISHSVLPIRLSSKTPRQSHQGVQTLGTFTPDSRNTHTLEPSTHALSPLRSLSPSKPFITNSYGYSALRGIRGLTSLGTPSSTLDLEAILGSGNNPSSTAPSSLPPLAFNRIEHARICSGREPVEICPEPQRGFNSSGLRKSAQATQSVRADRFSTLNPTLAAVPGLLCSAPTIHPWSQSSRSRVEALCCLIGKAGTYCRNGFFPLTKPRRLWSVMTLSPDLLVPLLSFYGLYDTPVTNFRIVSSLCTFSGAFDSLRRLFIKGWWPHPFPPISTRIIPHYPRATATPAISFSPNLYTRRKSTLRFSNTTSLQHWSHIPRPTITSFSNLPSRCGGRN